MPETVLSSDHQVITAEEDFFWSAIEACYDKSDMAKKLRQAGFVNDYATIA